MSVGDIRAGRAFVEISSDNTKLIAGMRSASRTLEKFGASVRNTGMQLGGAGLSLFTPLAAAAQSYASHSKAIDTGSKKTGLGAEAFSTLSYAADESGSSVEALTAGVAHMSRTLVEAASGSSEANAALAKLHLTVSQLSKLSQENRLKLIADHLAQIKDPADRAADAMAIFGKGGSELLPLLDQGSQGITSLQQHARELGLQISGPEAAAGAKFAHVLGDMWAVLGRGVDIIGSAVSPAFTEMAHYVTKGALAASDWVKHHQSLVNTIVKVAVGMIAGGAALVTFGTGISLLGFGIGGLAKLFSPVVGGIQMLGSAAGGVVGIVRLVGSAALFLINPFKLLPAIVAAGSAAFASVGTVLAAVLSPALLVGAAIIGIGGYFLYSSGLAGKAVAAIRSHFTGLGTYLKGLWTSVKTDALASFDGIKNALSAGDWATAAKILWTFLKLEFVRGADKIWHPLASAFYDVRAVVEDAWTSMQEYLSDWTGFKAAAEKVLTWLESKFASLTDYVATIIRTPIIEAQSETDTRVKYGGRTLTAGDADQLAGPALAQNKANAEKRWPNLVGTDEMADYLKDSGTGIRKKFQDQYAGKQLSEGQLQDLIAQETSTRIAAAMDVEKKKRESASSAYRDQQNQIDAAFATAEPDKVKAANDRHAAIAKQKADALAGLSPDLTTTINELSGQLKTLNTTAAKEKADQAKTGGDPWGIQSFLDLSMGVAESLTSKAEDAQAGLVEAGKTSTLGAFDIGSQTSATEMFGGANLTVQQQQLTAQQQMAAALNVIKTKVGPLRAV